MKKYFELTYQQLLIYGVHLGHTFANSVMYTAWLVYTYRDNMLIMNIFKTFYTMKVGFRLFNSAVQFRAPIWFVNLDRSASWYSKSAAYSCGEASWTIKWANGVLANYLRFQEVYRWLMQTSSEWAYRAKNKWVTDQYFDWKLTRQSWPRVILVSSVYHSKAPVKEALYLGIPCIGIVDTNVSTNRVMVAVPGNDESLECLAFYSDVVANYILIKKFSLINTWFMLRKSDRYISFKMWLRNKYDNINFGISESNIFGKSKLHISHILPNINLEKNLICSINAIFGRNDRFKTPFYSYLDFREHSNDNLDQFINTKNKAKNLAFVMQSRQWWLSFVGHVYVFKSVFKEVLHLNYDLKWDILIKVIQWVVVENCVVDCVE